jgi:hypothetical protein
VSLWEAVVREVKAIYIDLTVSPPWLHFTVAILSFLLAVVIAFGIHA